MSFKLSQDFRDRTLETVKGTFKALSQLANTFRVGIFGGAKPNEIQLKVAEVSRGFDKIQSINEANKSFQSLTPDHKPTIGLNIKK